LRLADFAAARASSLEESGSKLPHSRAPAARSIREMLLPAGATTSFYSFG
jgi:hypothetical protein